MKVKLLSAGLYGGLVNREPGETLELPDDLARDVAARGDGVLVLPKVAQLVPAFGDPKLPTIYEDDEPAEPVEAEAEKPVEAEAEKPAAPQVVKPTVVAKAPNVVK